MPIGTERQIKIFLTDKYPLVRKGLKEILDSEHDMRVVGETEDVREVLDKVMEIKPDILITDLHMPVTSSLGMIGDVKRLLPDIQVLVLTLRMEDRFEIAALKSGASGYLTKDTPPDEIIRTVRELASRRWTDPPSVIQEFASRPDEDVRLSEGQHHDASNPEPQQA